MAKIIEILNPKTATTTVAADAMSATVSWRYREQICDSVSCRKWWVNGTLTREIELSANTSTSPQFYSGTILWSDLELEYRIKQKSVDQEDCSCNDVTITCYGNIIDAWLDNSIYKCGEEDDGERTLYYTYKKITFDTFLMSEIITSQTNVTIGSNCDSITKQTVITSSKIVRLEDGSNDKAEYTYTVVPYSSCKEGDVILNLVDVKYDKDWIQYSGDSVNVTVYYKENTSHKDCTITYIDKVSAFTWDISSGDCSIEQAKACSDHYETSSVTIANGDAKLDVNLSMLVVKDDGTICPNCKKEECTYTTQYVIDANSATTMAFYKRYNSETQLYEWVSDGALPQNGGDIKVKYNYSAITVNTDCITTITPYSGFSYVVNISEIECNDSSATIITSGTTAMTEHGAISYFEYKQEQNKCDDKPKYHTVISKQYLQPQPVPCDILNPDGGTSGINVSYIIVEKTYDEYDTFISSNTISSGTETFDVYFNGEKNCGSTDRLVAHFSNENFSIYQARGCECQENNGNDDNNTEETSPPSST